MQNGLKEREAILMKRLAGDIVNMGESKVDRFGQGTLVAETGQTIRIEGHPSKLLIPGAKLMVFIDSLEEAGKDILEVYDSYIFYPDGDIDRIIREIRTNDERPEDSTVEREIKPGVKLIDLSELLVMIQRSRHYQASPRMLDRRPVDARGEGMQIWRSNSSLFYKPN